MSQRDTWIRYIHSLLFDSNTNWIELVILWLTTMVAMATNRDRDMSMVSTSAIQRRLYQLRVSVMSDDLLNSRMSLLMPFVANIMADKKPKDNKLTFCFFTTSSMVD